MTKIEGKLGEHISDTAKRALALVDNGKGPVCVEFNEITLYVDEGSSVSSVCVDYDKQCEQRRAVYVASPEYKERQRQAEERERQRAAKLAEALKGAPAAMTLKDPETWAKAVANNQDGYGACCMRYAETWARTMEGMIAGGATLVDCAKEASHLADSEGITGFMYGAAVSTLAAVWVHGDELRRWHNWTHGVSEEKAKGGTVNPAVLTVG